MISDTLYAEYIEEREDAGIIENDVGFLTFKIRDRECFLIDMFVKKSARKSGRGRGLLDSLEAVGRMSGCEVITANIFLQDPNANSTLGAALASGFRLESSANNVLLIAKKIEV